MIDAEWWEYDDADEMAEAVAGDIAYIIGQALEARGRALVAFPGGATPLPALKLLAIARNVANRVTIDRSGNAGGGPHPGVFAVTWRANMWANINRSGHGNLAHTHPGAFWSGVYYVDDGGIAADPSLGGALEFMDPRGAAPVMYAPHLGFAMKGGLSGGANEVLQPKAGRMVLFPSWLLHQVRHYRGTAERISIAFNLNL